MNNVELRNNFHHLIDSINNDNILLKFYAIMEKMKGSTDGKLWARLSVEEQKELLEADLDSNDPDNLIPQSEMKNKHSKWL